jgi:hypothetical protein
VRIYAPRILALSVGAGLVLAIVLGAVFALVSDADLVRGVAFSCFLVGLIVAISGLLGATEPEQGWATRTRGSRLGGRKSLIARLASEMESIDHVSSPALALWAVLTGGALIGVSILAFYLQ